MTWRLVFSKHAQKDAKKLKAAGLKENAENVLIVLARDPFEIPPPYETLAGDVMGLFAPHQYSTSSNL